MLGKRIFAVILVCSILFTLGSVGCTKEGGDVDPKDSVAKENNTEKDQGTTKENNTEEATQSPNLDERFEISYSWFKGNDEDEYIQAVEEKFNVDIKYVPIQYGERKEQVNLLVASGDMPDVCFYEKDQGQYKEWAEQGVIREVPEITEKYPNLLRLKELMGKDYELKAVVNGKTYGWPKFTAANNWNSYDFQTFIYRKDWAEKIGMAKDDDVYTWDEFLNLARAFIEKDPGNNGDGKTIAIASNKVTHITCYSNMYTLPLSYVKENGEYIWAGRMQETMEGIKNLKALYDEGLFWPDFYTAKDQDGHNIYASGTLGIYSYNFTLKNLTALRKSFANANPDIDTRKATTLMNVKGPDGKYVTREIINAWSMSIYKPDISDEKMERILYISDWLADTEATQMAAYGIKGTHWEEKDGEIILHWEKNDKGALIPPQMDGNIIRAAFAQLQGDLNYIAPDTDKKTVEDVKNFVEEFIPENTNICYRDVYIAKLLTPNYLEYGTFQQEFMDKVTELVVTSTNIEEDYKNWLKEMKPKIDSVLEEINSN